MSQDTVQRINDTSSTKLFFVSINDHHIKTNYITDFQLNYADIFDTSRISTESDIYSEYSASFVLTGFVVINDIIDVVNLCLDKPGQKILVNITDIYNEEFTREYVITKSTETKEQDSKTIRLDFQDIVSWKLQNTYIAKSYLSTTLLDVFKDYMALEVDALIDGFPIQKKFKSTSKISNFVVPLDVNFLDFISKEFYKEGIYFYQDKKNIYVGKFDIDPVKYIYKQVEQDYYGFMIMDYNGIFNDIRRIPRQDYLIYDENTKSIVTYKGDLEKFKDTYNLDVNDIKVYSEQQQTNGRKLTTHELKFNNSEHIFLDFKNNTVLEIVVPGNINYNQLYREITIHLTGNINSKDTLDKGDVKLSGKYKIFEIKDKILSNTFTQKMKIRRVGEQIDKLKAK